MMSLGFFIDKGGEQDIKLMFPKILAKQDFYNVHGFDDVDFEKGACGRYENNKNVNTLSFYYA